MTNHPQSGTMTIASRALSILILLSGLIVGMCAPPSKPDQRVENLAPDFADPFKSTLVIEPLHLPTVDCSAIADECVDAVTP